MSENPPTSVDRVLDALSDLEDRFDDRLAIFVDEILKWNPQLGLVSKRAPVDTTAKLIRQSAELYDFLLAHTAEVPRRVLDIGSGGGFPGVVWALMSPALELTLVERKTRKAGFLGRVAHRLQQTRVVVRAEDVEVTASIEEQRGAYGVVVMMAVALTEGLAVAAGRLLAPGGAVVTVRPVDAPDVRALTESARSERADCAFLLYR